MSAQTTTVASADAAAAAVGVSWVTFTVVTVLLFLLVIAALAIGIIALLQSNQNKNELKHFHHRPAYMQRFDTGITQTSSTTPAPLLFSTAISSQGVAYDTANGSFTVPYTGTYLITSNYVSGTVAHGVTGQPVFTEVLITPFATNVIQTAGLTEALAVGPLQFSALSTSVDLFAGDQFQILTWVAAGTPIGINGAATVPGQVLGTTYAAPLQVSVTLINKLNSNTTNCTTPVTAPVQGVAQGAVAGLSNTTSVSAAAPQDVPAGYTALTGLTLSGAPAPSASVAASSGASAASTVSAVSTSGDSSADPANGESAGGAGAGGALVSTDAATTNQ